MLTGGQRIKAKSATLQSHVPHPQAARIAEEICCVLCGKDQEISLFNDLFIQLSYLR